MGDYSYTTPSRVIEEGYEEYARKKREELRNIFNQKKDSAKTKLLKEMSCFNNTELSFESDLKDFKYSLVSRLDNNLSEISKKRFSKRKIGMSLIEVHQDILKYNEITREFLSGANWDCDKINDYFIRNY